MKKYILPLLLSLLVVFLVSQIFRLKKENERKEINLNTLNDSISYASIKIIEYGKVIEKQSASINTVNASNKEMKNQLYFKDKALKEVNKKYKELKSNYTISQEAKIDSLNVEYEDTAPCSFFMTGQKTFDNYSFNYTSTENGFNIKDLTIPNTLSIATGVEKSFFKYKLSTTTVNSNPIFKISKIQSQVTDIKRQRLSIAAGAGMNHNLQPQITLGVYYSLWFLD